MVRLPLRMESPTGDEMCKASQSLGGGWLASREAGAPGKVHTPGSCSLAWGWVQRAHGGDKEV